MHELGLCELNNIFNVTSKLLDLVFCWGTNVPLSRADLFVSPEDKHHSSLLTAVNCLAGNGSCNQVILNDSHLFSKTNYVKLRNLLGDID